MAMIMDLVNIIQIVMESGKTQCSMGKGKNPYSSFGTNTCTIWGYHENDSTKDDLGLFLYHLQHLDRYNVSGRRRSNRHRR